VTRAFKTKDMVLPSRISLEEEEKAAGNRVLTIMTQIGILANSRANLLVCLG
jgi:hypothetical protein